jgi:RES domain-containing protein
LDLDPRLVERIDPLPRSPFADHGYRHLGPGYQPTDGEGARINGGRWNPRGSFPVVYLALSVETAIAEFYRLAERQGMPPENLLPRHLYRVTVELTRVLDLRVPGHIAEAGLNQAAIHSNDAQACQAVGLAAHYVGFQGIVAESATGIGHVVAVFLDQFGLDCRLEPDPQPGRWGTLP